MADQVNEVHALLSLLGRSFGLDRLPLPRGDSQTSLLDVDAAVYGVCGAQSISAPVRLSLLGNCCPRMGREALKPIARSLIRTDMDDDVEPHADRLLEYAYGAEPGRDPLGRRPSSFRRAEPASDRGTQALASSDLLTQDAQDTVINVAPRCTAETEIIGGVPALSLTTTILSRQPFAEAKAMTDPMFWPQCEPQSLFFKAMTMLDPPGRKALPDGRDGWSARVLEVVDFSYGLAPGAADMETELDFVYFESEFAAGCTYDLHRSPSRDILVDRGYVLCEDLRSIDVRRTTTLKQVYFRTRSNPGDVCRFWSLAHGMVSSSCSTPQAA